VELSAGRQSKDDQHEMEEQQGNAASVLHGYRVLEGLRTYPSVVHLERTRSSEVWRAMLSAMPPGSAVSVNHQYRR